jgi:hypothetical protein
MTQLPVLMLPAPCHLKRLYCSHANIVGDKLGKSTKVGNLQWHEGHTTFDETA